MGSIPTSNGVCRRGAGFTPASDGVQDRSDGNVNRRGVGSNPTSNGEHQMRAWSNPASDGGPSDEDVEGNIGHGTSSKSASASDDIYPARIDYDPVTGFPTLKGQPSELDEYGKAQGHSGSKTTSPPEERIESSGQSALGSGSTFEEQKKSGHSGMDSSSAFEEYTKLRSRYQNLAAEPPGFTLERSRSPEENRGAPQNPLRSRSSPPARTCRYAERKGPKGQRAGPT